MVTRTTKITIAQQPVPVKEPAKTLDQFDLASFRNMKEDITKAANQEIANKISQIESLLGDIKFIVEETGVECSFYHIQSGIQDIERNRNWNSSSEYC